MDATLDHPRWILAGIVLLFAGFWLMRWSRRNDATAEISSATTEAAFNKLLKKPAEKNVTKRGLAGARFRNSMAQFLGIVGGLMIIAGLVAMVFGVFYSGDVS